MIFLGFIGIMITGGNFFGLFLGLIASYLIGMKIKLKGYDFINSPNEKPTSPAEKTKKILTNFPENIDEYKELTLQNNWLGICIKNGIELDSFGTRKELDYLKHYLEDNEVVFALASGIMGQTGTSNATDFGLNTWLVVLTNERFLFMDAAMLSESFDTQSVRHNRIQAVSASQGISLGKISIDLGSRLIIVDNCNKQAVQIIANMANKWIRKLEYETESSNINLNQNNISETPMDKLEKISELYSKGILTEDEFIEAKKKLLEKL